MSEKLEVGSIVEGKVVRMVPFGAFIELAVHHSEVIAFIKSLLGV